MRLASVLLLFCVPLATGARAGEPADPNIAEVLDVTPPPQSALGEVIEPEPEDIVAPNPDLPTARITSSETPQHGAWLLLDGAQSSNPLRGELQYQWKQSGPRLPFLPEELTRPQLWVFLAFPGQYRFSLRVKNAKGQSPTREVVLNVQESKSGLSLADARKLCGAGEEVQLPGEGWRQIAGPNVNLKRVEKGLAFRPVVAATYIFERPGLSGPPERRGIVLPAGKDETFGNRRPFARLPKNIVGTVGKPLLINGSLSMDQDGVEETRKLTAKWTTPEKFRGVELEALAGLRARFTAPRAGTYHLMLTVSDGRLESAPESVFVQIERDTETPLRSGLPGVLEEDLAGADRDDVLYRSVKLGLRGDLDRAVQMFPSRCGIALRIDADVAAPEQFKQIPLALEVDNNALMHLLTWVARQTNTRFRRDSNRSVWLVKPLTWVKEEKLDTAGISIDALHANPDASDLMEPLRAHFQPILDASPGASMHYVPERAAIQLFAPVSCKARLKEIELSLRAPEGMGIPPPDLPTPAEFNLRQTLAEKTVSLKAENRRLDYVLRDFSAATGLATAMDPRQFPNGIPYVTVKIEDLVVRDAVRRLVEAGGFDGCAVEAPGGLWFYKGAEPYPSGESLWDITQVRGYDLSQMVRALAPLSGEAIAHAIRSRIYRDSWKDPGALCFYHAKTKKLIVMHGPAAHQRIVEFLHDLAERKEWALGPVE
jgi:hypothetical protein